LMNRIPASGLFNRRGLGRRLSNLSMRTPIDEEQECEQQQNDRYDQQAAFRAIGSAAPERVAHRCCGKQMVLRGKAAVGRAIEEGFSPVQGRVAADGQPGRSGEPDADAKNKADESGGEDTNRVLAVVAGVEESEGR